MKVLNGFWKSTVHAGLCVELLTQHNITEPSMSLSENIWNFLKVFKIEHDEAMLFSAKK